MLFDDIEPELCLVDKAEFSSSAEAQAFLTNKIYEWFLELSVVLFCPTGMSNILLLSILKIVHAYREPSKDITYQFLSVDPHFFPWWLLTDQTNYLERN